MTIVVPVSCYICHKKWETLMEVLGSEKCDLVGQEFCGTCRRTLMKGFEAQFGQRLLPKSKLRIWKSEEDGA